MSFANTRFVPFWSKNPKPLIPYLPILQEKGIGFYIQFTLNDYDAEQLEPGVPRLAERIDTFKRIVDEYGVGSVVWRFDPLILTEKISTELLLHRISAIAEQLKGYTEKLQGRNVTPEQPKANRKNCENSHIFRNSRFLA